MQLKGQNQKLPNAEPGLIMLGSTDPRSVKQLDEKLISMATKVDVRSDVVWIEVENCRTFLRELVERIPHSGTKVAFSKPDASPEQLVHDSLHASSIEEIVDLIEQDDIANEKLEYEVRYQPIVRLPNRSVIGYEALIRARSETEIVGAEELIARATKSGWLGELDQLGRRLAIQGLGPWLGAGLLFMNIMAPDGTFDLTAARQTIRHAEDVGLEPDQIVLETAERNRYTNIDLAAAQLNKLRATGVRLAIDDMGEGYSTLVVATSFKPDVLKLSGELIHSLPSKEAIAAVEAVVSLAHRTGAWVVAEKIETEAQADTLRSLDVDWGQGRLFGEPTTKTPGALN